MQDKKYIPIIASVLLLAAFASLAYYLFTARKPKVEAPFGMEPALLEALNKPSESTITSEEFDELTTSLFAPGEQGAQGGGDINALYDALSAPLQ